MTKKHTDCDHIIGYLGRTSAIHGSCGTSASLRVGMDDDNAQIVRQSGETTFEDLVTEGVKFDFCPFCGEHFKWKNPEAE